MIKLNRRNLLTSVKAYNSIMNNSHRFYVYVLVNPLTLKPMYVGKGTGSRCFTHWENRFCDDTYKSRYLRLIKSKDILYYIQDFFTEEIQAFDLEAKLINHFGLRLDGSGILINRREGQGDIALGLKIDQIIEQFNLVHNQRYDYSLVKYKGTHTKVEILCKEHGSFWQSPTSHKTGQGCPACGVISLKRTQRKPIGDVLNDFNHIHKFRYDYSLVSYVNSYTKVIIVCSKHGKFNQSPANHLKGHGCPKCGSDSTVKKQKNPLDYIIGQFIKTHGNRYEYSKVRYVNLTTKVKILCLIHGYFFQTPTNHRYGAGCPRCSKQMD